MVETILRKCGACPDPIEIDRNHTSNVVFYKKKYYHSKCFYDLATKRSQAKIKSASEWKDALDNLWELEADTKKMLESALVKNELNEWLLTNYDIVVVPSRFWQVVADLERGVYKGKKCRPISMEILLGTWKWGQKKLDSIARNNKANHKGPQNDEARLAYDLAILIGHISDYTKYINKIKSAEIERENKRKEEIKVDYNKIKTSSNDNHGLDDINELLDDLI